MIAVQMPPATDVNSRGEHGMSLADSSLITKTFFARVETHDGIENAFDILLVVPEYVRPPSITLSMTLRAQRIQRSAVARVKKS